MEVYSNKPFTPRAALSMVLYPSSGSADQDRHELWQAYFRCVDFLMNVVLFVTSPAILLLVKAM